MRPRLLDLFAGEGGAAVGYERAGYDVISVELDAGRAGRNPTPTVVADALAPPFDLAAFDLIHASPPCQRFTTMSANPGAHPDLIGPTRDLVAASGVPYVIENVPGAPLRRDVILCGSMFGLEVRRHRVFELGGWFTLAPPCWHRGDTVGVYGNPGDIDDRFAGGGHRYRDGDEARAVMGMPWASREGCTLAIPPAYAEYLGRAFMDTR